MDTANEIFIDCECGTHVLRVQNEIELHGENKEAFSQEFYFAMYYYGIGSSKRKFWHRVKIAWNYLRTGKMFSDQLCLNPDEAKKLCSFLIEKFDNPITFEKQFIKPQL